MPGSGGPIERTSITPMSSPSGGSYYVDREAVERKRRFVLAGDQCHRLQLEMRALAIEQKAAVQTWNVQLVELQIPPAALPESLEEREQLARSMQQHVAQVRSDLQTATTAARRESIASALSAAFVRSTRPRKNEPAEVVSAAKEPRDTPHETQLAELLRLAERAAPLNDEAIDAYVSELIERIPSISHSQMEKEVLSLRLSVQEATERARELERIQERRTRVLESLDGHVSPEVDELRKEIARVPVGTELSRDIEARARKAIDSARRREDATFTLDALRQGLQHIGFSVGPEFTTAVSDPSGAIVDLPGWSSYGVRVQESGGRLGFNVVRYGELDDAQAPPDAQAEAEWCDGLDRLATALQDLGVDLSLHRREEPGSLPLQVVDARTRPTKARRRPTLKQKRDR